MSVKLVRTLTVAIESLKSGQIPYNWNNPGTDNVGVVLCAGFGIPSNELQYMFDDYGHELDGLERSWSSVVSYFCPLDGMADDLLFQQMEAIGLQRNDIHHLDYLNNLMILESAGFVKQSKFPKFWQKEYRVDYRSKDNLIQYLEGWVHLLTNYDEDEWIGDVDNVPPPKMILITTAKPARPRTHVRVTDN